MKQVDRTGSTFRSPERRKSRGTANDIVFSSDADSVPACVRACVRGRMVRASGQTDSTCHRRTLPMYSVRIAAGNRESYFAVGMLGVGCQRWDRQASVCLVRPSRPRTYRTVTSGVNSRRQRFDEFWRASFGRNLAAGMSVVGHSRNQRRRVGPRIARMTRMNLLRRD